MYTHIESWKATGRQVAIGLVASFSLFCGGAAYSWTNQIMDKIPERIPMSVPELSVAVAIVQIGSLVTPIPAGLLMNTRLGRKWTLLTSAPLFIIAWVLNATTHSYAALVVSRFIQGAAAGIPYSVIPLYLAEIAHPNIRGGISSLFHLSFSMGAFYIYIIGAFCDYEGIQWFGTGPVIVFAILFLFCPDTPYLYCIRGQEEQSRRTLQFFRASKDVEKEFSEIKDYVKEDQEGRGVDWKELFCSKSGWKALFIGSLLPCIEMISGLPAIMSYSASTLTITNGPRLASNITVVIGLVITICPLISLLTTDHWGRRKVLLTTSTISTVALFCTSIYFYTFQFTSFNTSYVSWVGYTCILLYMGMDSMGPAALRPTVQAEVFSNNLRGLASGFISVLVTVMAFISLATYHVLESRIGMYLNYLFFGIFSLLGTIAIYYCLPETRGKTLKEVQKVI